MSRDKIDWARVASKVCFLDSAASDDIVAAIREYDRQRREIDPHGDSANRKEVRRLLKQTKGGE